MIAEVCTRCPVRRPQRGTYLRETKADERPRSYSLAGLLVLILASGAPPTLPADEASQDRESVEQQLQAADERLRKLGAEIEASRQRKAALQDSLEANDERLGERRDRVDALDRDIADFDARLDDLQGEVERAAQTIDTRRRLLTEALRRSQRIADNSGLKALLQHDDPALANRLGIYADYALRAQRESIAEQIEALSRIEAAAATALKDRNWLNYIQRKASSQRDALAASGADNRRNLAEVDNSLSEKTRTVGELRADQERLQTLMNALDKTPGAGSGYFAAGQGDWSLPVTGTIKARFGDTKAVGNVTWNGLFISADAGGPVRTIADGEVVYSDWLNGFGMLVIVDHGDAWMSLYGGNREVLVDPGSWVESGMTIATIGNGIVGNGIAGEDGAQRPDGVYFEIRRDAEPVNPADWIRMDGGA